MKSNEIRSKFLKFFQSKSHKIVKSSPMVIKNDPTLMFANAGMNQFKDNFLGNIVSKDNRIANTQKCLRVSGKHNDLEEVGVDTYHHTMFEMLGNWSFGDYFKKEAIEWAWELLTEVYKIDKENLYVTVFEGSEKDGTNKDLEAYDLWKKIVDVDKIILGNKNDNFWEMGEFGPCGPSSEIHIDIRSKNEKNKISGRDLVNKDHPEVIEIWNLVFIEFNRKTNGVLEKLPDKHIDTGMGLERLCMIIQGLKSNYETDIFLPTIKELELICKSKYQSDDKKDVAFRVIVDHLRAVVFSIADGQLPSNNGAGYVIRRILRRAIRYGYTYLDLTSPFIYKLVEIMSEQFSEVFPEVKNQVELIKTVIKEEEKSFLKTLEMGINRLNENITNTKNNKISGSDAFELYDTYGFPIDLTSLILKEKGMTFDADEFNFLMNQQKSRSKSSITPISNEWVKVVDTVKNNVFIGYDNFESKSAILRYRKVKNKNKEDIFHIVFDKTPFYPRGGGQVGDKGYISLSKNKKIEVLDTFKENDSIVHITKHIPEINNDLTLIVDRKKRLDSSCNHTATHLLHQALRKVLGKHVQQKGSMVSDEYLRFDFSHFSKLSNLELEDCQNFVNEKIVVGLKIEENRNASLEDCLNSGVIALFGEKYGEIVRSIKFGDSYELCGGTHVNNTNQLRSFIIISESAISTGIRRIEALSGKKAIDYLINQSKTLIQVNELLLNPKNTKDAIYKLKNQNSALNKKIDNINNQLIKYYLDDINQNIFTINNLKCCTYEFNCSPDVLKNLAFKAGNLNENLVLILFSKFEGKVFLMSYISKNIISNVLDANKIVSELSKFINGNGGGQQFFATATGDNTSGIKNLLENSKKLLIGLQ